ncbi:MAG: glycoside hydrolase family 27 protein [Myxococcales bacterium]
MTFPTQLSPYLASARLVANHDFQGLQTTRFPLLLTRTEQAEPRLGDGMGRELPGHRSTNPVGSSAPALIESSMETNPNTYFAAIAAAALLACGNSGSSAESTEPGVGSSANPRGGTTGASGSVSKGGSSTVGQGSSSRVGQGGSSRVGQGGSSRVGEGGNVNPASDVNGGNGGVRPTDVATATGGSRASGGASQVSATAAGGHKASGGKSASESAESGGRSTSGGVNVFGGSNAGGGKAAGGNAAGGTANMGGTKNTGGTGAALAATPPMGWNSWNTFGCNGLTEALVKGVADAFVSSGMKDAGYQYVNLDDCWMRGRDGAGNVQVNTSRFPAGMKALADYVHAKGLKIGLYSTPGTKTCAAIYGGYTDGVGSLGYETKDAQAYASWGIDYLKYDKCTASLSGFAPMRDALRATGRPIFYSINPGDGTGCVPGKCSIDLPTTAHMWRIGFDINASWSSMIGLADQNEPLYSYAGPGHFNDPDMLEVGKLANASEDRAHFSLWAIMAAPLIAGNDIRSMSTATKDILTNLEVIAVDQDPLGIQGHIVSGKGANLQIWAKKLSGTNTVAAVLLNRGTASASITAQWSQLGIPTGAATVRDLWSHTDLGSFTGSYAASAVPGHGVVMIKVTSSS